jgi:uncharacterized protein YndB with AHSA1/START domain
MGESEVSVVVRRVLNAPLARVWAAYSSAEELALWYKPGADYVITLTECDFRIGGRYRIGFQRPGDPPLLEVGRYVEINPMARIIYDEEVTENGAPHHAMRDQVDFTALSPTQTLVLFTSSGPKVWLAGGGIFGCIECLAAYVGDQ